ncbi:MAG TPA: NAD(P)-binding protein [Candidatus Eisenbacteria bacterium]|nr:NAD(P)-binding protein [Candidatus Eisenbacteria bacterium]
MNMAKHPAYLPRPAGGRRPRFLLFDRAILIVVRRLVVPFLLYLLFLVTGVLVYMRLENLPLTNALFWFVHPHAIDYLHVRTATKYISILVSFGVFAFEIWFAERILLTFLGHQGREVWKSMMNEMNLERIRDHFIICGYGQVGRTVIEQLTRSHIPFVLIETNEGLYRQLLHEGALVIQGDAKRHSVLQEAGIARARGLCVVIDNDADNLYITITAKALNPKLKIITRAGQERYAEAMRTSGADEVVIPEFEGGKLASQLVEKYAIRL